METPYIPKNAKSAPPLPLGKRVARPYDNGKTDPATWAYDHRAGLCVTVIVFLVAGIVFMSAQIAMHPKTTPTAIFVDLREMPQQPEQRPMTPEERQQFEDVLRNVRNQVSNENASTSAQSGAARGGGGAGGADGLRDASDERLYQSGEELAGRMRASREMYERGNRELQEMIDRSRRSGQQQGADEQARDVKIKGNVVISFSLVGRSAVYLHRPTYQCEGGGEVVVNITVNRNGHVTAAAISSASSSDDNCLIERALSSARSSQFNVDASASDRQSGVITYLFVPQ